MKAIEDFLAEDAGNIKYVLCDIDDTMTTKGKLTSAAYGALWRLHEAGIHVIPVTGRPAGWCDLIVRQWPVRGIIGENGAFAYYFDTAQQLQTLTHPNVVENAQEKLQQVKERVLQQFPQARVSKDQFCRRYDLAIDFNEDPPYLGFAVAEQIKDLCLSMGAEAKVSSIHVNTWFGRYDKVSMADQFLQTVLGEENPIEHAFFFGDSPNDAPMFAHFPHSCGVANIKPFLADLAHKPSYITAEESGAGFCQGVEIILQKRGEFAV